MDFGLGVDVAVGIGVGVDVAVGVGVGVDVAVGVGVWVDVAVGVDVRVGVAVGDGDTGLAIATAVEPDAAGTDGGAAADVGVGVQDVCNSGLSCATCVSELSQARFN